MTALRRSTALVATTPCYKCLMMGLLQNLMEGRNQQPSATFADHDKVNQTARLSIQTSCSAWLPQCAEHAVG